MTTTEIVTLTLSVCALVVSVIAAVASGLQARWTKHAATRKYEVEAVIGQRNARNGLVVHSDKMPSENAVEINARQGFTENCFGVIVRNTGALPIVVRRWTLKAENGSELSPMLDSLGPDMPHQVMAGDAASWWVDAGIIMHSLHIVDEVLKNKPGGYLVGIIECGDGTQMESKRLRLK